MMRRIWLIFASLLLLALACPARDKAPDTKDEGKAGTVVDAGTFAVFQDGQRLATEDFTIRQFSASSITTSHLRLTAANPGQQSGTLEQVSELTLLANGNVSRYEWKESSPAVRSAVVEPKDDLLVMHTVADGKNYDHTFFMNPSTFVLDDYVFSVREVLLWRYLATSCQRRSTGDGCDLIRARFPIIVPLRETSGEVYIEFAGYDDTPLNGRPQHLRHLVMKTDGPDWHFWLDENLKLLRISIPDAKTEVLRQDK